MRTGPYTKVLPKNTFWRIVQLILFMLDIINFNCMDEKSTEMPFKISSRKSYRFGTTGGWANDDRIFIFVWTIPLYRHHIILGEPDENKANRNIKKWKWDPRRVCVCPLQCVIFVHSDISAHCILLTTHLPHSPIIYPFVLRTDRCCWARWWWYIRMARTKVRSAFHQTRLHHPWRATPK